MSVTIDQLTKAIAQTQEVLESLERHFPRPELVESGGRQLFRHREKNDLLLSQLKCVRAVSSLNACVILLQHGYVQEIGALCRCIDEFNQDVFFLGTPLGEDGPSEQQKCLTQEFFQEEFDKIDSPFRSSQQRTRVPRKKVLAGIARVSGQPLNPSDTQEMHRTVHNAFSGYVHGAYVHIMESYGGGPGNLHYHMCGLSGTPRIPEWTKALLNYVYRTMHSVEVVAKRCDDAAAVQAIQSARFSLETDTGVGLDDPKEILEKMKRKEKKRQGPGSIIGATNE
jgi:hypothetical protein